MGLAKVVVPRTGKQYSADSFVGNQILVLRVNPECIRDGKNRHLRQTRNR